MAEQRKSQMLLKDAMTTLKSVYAKEVGIGRNGISAGKPRNLRLLSCKSSPSPSPSQGSLRNLSSRPGGQKLATGNLQSPTAVGGLQAAVKQLRRPHPTCWNGGSMQDVLKQ